MPSSCSASIGGNSKSRKSNSKSRNSKSRKSTSRKSTSGKSRRVKGGSGLEAAIVPFGFLAIQQWFGSRSRSNKTRKSSRK